MLRSLFPPDKDLKFRPYFNELLSLCQYGLVGPTAQPIQAMDTLRNLQNQIFDTEKGRAISSHMRGIIKWQAALLGGLVIVMIAVELAFWRFAGEKPFRDVGSILLAALVAGLFVGIVFSSFLRCRTVTFYDLHAIEAEDLAVHEVRVCVDYANDCGCFSESWFDRDRNIKVHLSAFNTDLLSAFVFGVVVGIAQEAIIYKIELIRDRIDGGPGRRGARGLRRN